MIILDASALVDLVIGAASAPSIERQLADHRQVAAPELLLVEVSSALWRRVRSGHLTAARSENALAQALRVPVTTVPHRGLTPTAWRFREHVRITDAFYLACAQRLGVPVLTTDARLARGHHGVPVTLVT